MKRILTSIIFILSCTLVLMPDVHSHSGRTDRNGGHFVIKSHNGYQYRTSYHYHTRQESQEDSRWLQDRRNQNTESFWSKNKNWIIGIIVFLSMIFR